MATRRDFPQEHHARSRIGRCAGLCAALLLAAGTAHAALGLQRIIRLPDLRGQFGHLALDRPDQRLFIAVTGSNVLLALDLVRGVVGAETGALPEPRDVVFLPDGRVAVSSLGSGTISFYDARTLDARGSLVFGSTAGALRFDMDAARLYFAYGREPHGGIAILDTNGTLYAQLPLRGLPRGLLPAAAARRLYASFSVPDRIVVFDTATGERVADWSLGNTPGTNYPLALNADGTHLFVAGRRGDEIAVLDTRTGRLLQSIAAPGGAGSMQFDAQTHELYVAAGVGELGVYEEDADGVLHERSRIATRRGARTGLLDAKAGRYYLALPAGREGAAEIRVYRVIADRHPGGSLP